MANSAQSKKRARQSKKRELHNSSQRSVVRTAIKKILRSLQVGDDARTTQDAYQHAVRLLDRASSRRIIHSNKAARLKSRLRQKLKNFKQDQ